MFVCKFSLFIYVFPTGPAYAIYVSYADGAICAESAVKHQPANNQPNVTRVIRFFQKLSATLRLFSWAFCTKLNFSGSLVECYTVE